MALGIAIFIMGHPLIFFFRDGLKLAPNSSVFTAVCLAGGLVLMIPGTIFSKFYPMNMKIITPLLGWLAVAIFYLLFNNPMLGALKYDLLREFINYGMVLAFMFLLLNVPNEVKDHFVPVFVVFTLMGNLGLFYSLITNPFYVIGSRASIYFDDEFGGNPHVFARNGFAGFIASIMMLLARNWLWRVLAYVNLIASLLCVLLTQTRSAMLAMIVMFVLFAYYHIRPANLKRFAKAALSPGNLAFILIAFGGLIVFLITKRQYLELITGYFDIFWERFLAVWETAAGYGNYNRTYEAADASAEQRVRSLTYFSWTLMGNPSFLVLGGGYRFLYLDFPVLEAMIDCGILGFYFFGKVALECTRESLRAIKTLQNPLTTFLAYLFIPIFIALFTSGQPFDTPFLFFFTMMGRFMGTKYADEPEPPLPKNTQVPKLESIS